MNAPDIPGLQARASGGDLHALTRLGWCLLIGQGIAAAPAEGVRHIRQAADLGHGEATSLLATFAAWGIERGVSIPDALELLQRAAEQGWEPAQRELQFLARRDGSSWAALRAAIDVGQWTAPPPVRIVSESPRIRVFEKFASPAECDWLITLARRNLGPAKIYRKDGPGHVQSSTRTNTEASYWLGNSDTVLYLLSARVAAAAGSDVRFFEIAKLLHYEPGQQFAPHCDFQEPVTPALREEIAKHGQRVATALIYLNDDYTGGETDFPRIGRRFKCARGDALLFWNVTPAGALDYDTLHAGLPPTSGVKWVFSQWIRDRAVS